MTRIPQRVAAAAFAAAVLTLSACTGVVELAHGDPGRQSQGSAQTVVAQASVAQTPIRQASPAQSPAAAGVAASPVGSSGQPAEVGVVSAVTVTFNDHVQQLAASDPRLTPAAVALAVEGELRAHQLYAPGADSVHRTVAITVQDFNSSLASNASVLGYTFRNLALIGEIRVQDAPTGAGTPAAIQARTRAANRDSAAQAGSLAGLYARFAVLTVADLRGVAAPAQPIPR